MIEDSEDVAGRYGYQYDGRETGDAQMANDLVWLHNGSRQESGQERVRASPPPELNQAKGGEGRIVLIIME